MHVPLLNFAIAAVIISNNLIISDQMDCFAATDNMIEIAVECNIYSVIEGNELELCVVVLAGSSLPEFEVAANLDYNCKLQL